MYWQGGMLRATHHWLIGRIVNKLGEEADSEAMRTQRREK